MMAEQKFKLGEAVEISVFADHRGPRGIIFGVTEFIDGSHSYYVVTNDFGGTTRHPSLTEYELQKLDLT